MRIIAGEYKSRKINTGPLSKTTIRPSSDRTRETLFNILIHRIQLQGLTCLDLFSGTGIYGFEALSRGAARCDFVDISGKALELARRTSEELGCNGRINVIKADAVRFLRSKDSWEYALIFADPPYEYNDYTELIRLVLKKNFRVFVLEFGRNYFKKLSEYDHLYEDRCTIINRAIGSTYLKIFLSKTYC